MKKLLFILLFTSITVVDFGQTITYGIKGGLNLGQLSYGAMPFTHRYGAKFLVGFNAGGVIDIGFKDFSIQPGIFYSIKGDKSSAQLTSERGTENITATAVLNYIEVPVNVFYKPVIAHDIHLSFGGGPYIGYGISQTLSLEAPYQNDPITKSHHFSYKNPDWGVN